MPYVIVHHAYLLQRNTFAKQWASCRSFLLLYCNHSQPQEPPLHHRVSSFHFFVSSFFVFLTRSRLAPDPCMPYVTSDKPWLFPEQAAKCVHIHSHAHTHLSSGIELHRLPKSCQWFKRSSVFSCDGGSLSCCVLTKCLWSDSTLHSNVLIPLISSYFISQVPVILLSIFLLLPTSHVTSVPQRVWDERREERIGSFPPGFALKRLCTKIP